MSRNLGKPFRGAHCRCRHRFLQWRRRQHTRRFSFRVCFCSCSDGQKLNGRAARTGCFFPLIRFDRCRKFDCVPPCVPSFLPSLPPSLRLLPSPAGHSIKILRADEGQTNLHAFTIIAGLTTSRAPEEGRKALSIF